MNNSISATTRIRLPRIAHVDLEEFDLYTRRPSASLKIDHSVFCLIGANGLGKSTFLSTLIYGLTGGLPFRARGFQSPKEYSTDATRTDRREDYFGGRLSEDALKLSSVTVRLAWPALSLEVTRRIAGDGGVAALKLKDAGAASFTAVDDQATELDRQYRDIVATQCKLTDFNQFIFLMHFVCLFDEDRYLLLWEPKALTNALYLAFGSDLDQATKATELRRRVERFSSRARNNAFAARKAREAAENLQNVLDGDARDQKEDINADVRRSFERLTRDFEDAIERLQRKETELSRANAAFHDYSAQLAELQLEYDEVFSSRTRGARIIAHHPLVRTTLQSDRCAVCTTEGVAGKVKSSVDAGACPLCNSSVNEAEDDAAAIARLKALDKKIEEVRVALDLASKRRRRIQDEHQTATQSENASRVAREEFLRENPSAQDSLSSTHNNSNRFSEEVKRHLLEAERFSSISQEDYRNRDKARKELLVVERKLKAQFEQHSDQFVNLFRTYAEDFIGLQVDIELEHRQGRNDTGFFLVLSLEDQVRSVAVDVSESQRFFLEIALRMALTEFMTETVATLLIDTPEGSLDISYEARAGQMFSNFADRENCLFITANLRSSALLKRLAEKQKVSGMQIERMTDWTDLSEVQREEEVLFLEAYEDIEKALR